MRTYREFYFNLSLNIISFLTPVFICLVFACLFFKLFTFLCYVDNLNNYENIIEVSSNTSKIDNELIKSTSIYIRRSAYITIYTEDELDKFLLNQKELSEELESNRDSLKCGLRSSHHLKSGIAKSNK